MSPTTELYSRTGVGGPLLEHTLYFSPSLSPSLSCSFPLSLPLPPTFLLPPPFPSLPFSFFSSLPKSSHTPAVLLCNRELMIKKWNCGLEAPPLSPYSFQVQFMVSANVCLAHRLGQARPYGTYLPQHTHTLLKTCKTETPFVLESLRETRAQRLGTSPSRPLTAAHGCNAVSTLVV